MLQAGEGRRFCCEESVLLRVLNSVSSERRRAAAAANSPSPRNRSSRTLDRRTAAGAAERPGQPAACCTRATGTLRGQRGPTGRQTRRAWHARRGGDDGRRVRVSHPVRAPRPVRAPHPVRVRKKSPPGRAFGTGAMPPRPLRGADDAEDGRRGRRRIRLAGSAISRAGAEGEQHHATARLCVVPDRVRPHAEDTARPPLPRLLRSRVEVPAGSQGEVILSVRDAVKSPAELQNIALTS